MNSDTLAASFTQAIDQSLYLEREDLSTWQLTESGRDISLRASNRHSLAFTLDANNTGQNHKPLAFFTAAPPTGVGKMCDAIVVYDYRGQGYIFCLEVKSSDKGDYKGQLNNGLLFCKWLVKLLTYYGHYKTTPTYYGVLVYTPRSKSVSKGGTAHKGRFPISADPQDFAQIFKLANRELIPLTDLIEADAKP